MKISILAFDASQNGLVRAYLLARILQRRYAVEIVGPVVRDGIWGPLAEPNDVEYKFVKLERKPDACWRLAELVKKITGEVIYASKPLLTSFGVGLFKKCVCKSPLVLDIDDWQMGFMKQSLSELSIADRFLFLAHSALLPYLPSSYWNNRIGEELAHFADDITVSSSFLQRKFGGEIVWHGQDTDAFDPRRFDKSRCREKHGIEKEKEVVMFCGTPRPYKGLEDLIEATWLMHDKSVILSVVGLSEDKYCQDLEKAGRQMLGDSFRPFGLQPFERIPEILAMADVIALPQRRSFATVGQVPTKVFDAMAMAKPIVATAVSDLPEILEGCGWLVEPGNTKQLAETIRHVLHAREEAKKKGWKARQRCVERYGMNAMEEVLMEVFGKYE